MKITKLPSDISEGLVLKIALRPHKGETERSILIPIFGGVKRHVHLEDIENYCCLLNLSFSRLKSVSWVGVGRILSYHEIPRVFGICVVLSRKRLPDLPDV